MILRVKIRCSDLWVRSHDKSSDFYCSAWQRGGSPWPLLCVRAALATAALSILAWSLASGTSGASPYWLIYLTNWGLVLVAAEASSALLVSWLAAYSRPPENATPWYAALYWVLFNTVQTVALAITILYWGLLYDPEYMVYPSASALWLDVATHALNSVLTLAELAAARTPVRWPHVYQPLMLAALYVAFSGIYYAAGGLNMFGEPYIYNVLDWRSAGVAGAVAGGSLVGVLALHSLVWALAHARSALARRLLPERRQPDRPPRLAIPTRELKQLHNETCTLAENATPWYAALYWVLFNTVQTVALAITILYWGLLYDPEYMVYPSASALWLDVATHALNSVLTLAELAAARTPVRWPHVYQPLMLAALYVAFSGIYYAAGGLNMFGEPYIYNVLDWRSAGVAGAVAGGSLVGVLALHSLVWVLARARSALARRLLPERRQPDRPPRLA